MTIKERRVVDAFCRCVNSGEMSREYATILLEDTGRYGWMSEEARSAVYASFPEEGTETQTADDAGTAERLAELEEALEMILSGVTDNEA